MVNADSQFARLRRELASPRLAPFFAAAEEQGVLLFMHPPGFTRGGRL